MKLKSIYLVWGVVLSILYSGVIALLAIPFGIVNVAIYGTAAMTAIVAGMSIYTLKLMGWGYPASALGLGISLLPYSLTGMVCGLALVALFSVPVATASAVFQIVTSVVSLFILFVGFCYRDVDKELKTY